MAKCGFSTFTYLNGYFYSSAYGEQKLDEHVGQLRVTFKYNKCGQTSIMAQ